MMSRLYCTKCGAEPLLPNPTGPGYHCPECGAEKVRTSSSFWYPLLRAGRHSPPLLDSRGWANVSVYCAIAMDGAVWRTACGREFESVEIDRRGEGTRCARCITAAPVEGARWGKNTLHYSGPGAMRIYAELDETADSWLFTPSRRTLADPYYAEHVARQERAAQRAVKAEERARQAEAEAQLAAMQPSLWDSIEEEADGSRE